MITIIDYGMGNTGSVKNALEALGYDSVVSYKESDIEKSSHLILPGVGSFKEGMDNLINRGLVAMLEKAVLHKKKPLLGICLGMQLLGSEGEEGGGCRGLDWIKGKVVKFKLEDKKLRLPHVGWNDVYCKNSSILFAGINNPIFYFVHSYHLVPENPEFIAARSDYGESFVSAVQKDNIFGVQFHPEKSQHSGLRLLDNFLKI
jgi:imidazole glycerol-phosphate synthase subunit HisH